jgi:Tfp pilus assembly protein PilF
LARLADQVKSAKTWDVGISFIQDGMFNLIEGEPYERALSTLRFISYCAGFILLLAAAFAARVIFETNPKRLLFFGGVASGGYALQFFGYVENYALLISFMTMFVLMGVAAAKEKISHFWAVIPFLLAVFLHGFGLVLLPALVFLLLRSTKAMQILEEMSGKKRLYLGLGVLALGVIVYAVLYYNVRFFTFAFLPLLPDQFTVDSNFLLSPKHFIDMVNLLLMLFPGFLILTVVMLVGRGRMSIRGHDSTFLLICLTTSLVAIFVFSPRLGMPRDWDLFAFVGVPLVVYAYHLFLTGFRSARSSVLASGLSIVLSLLVLIPRVTSQAVPDIAISHFEDYLQLDKIQNRNAWSLLVDYYRNTGNSTRADAVNAQSFASFPESSYNAKGKELLGTGKVREASQYFERAIDLNPLYYDGYANLGVCMIQFGDLDSAFVLLEIANGLNAFNSSILTNLGTVQMRRGSLESARSYLTKALSIDSTSESALASMVSTELQLGNYEQSAAYIQRLSDHSSMPGDYYRQAAVAYLEAGAIAEAATALKLGLQRGLTINQVRELQNQYPALEQHFR